MMHAYNSTQHSITRYSPYFLLFGREPTLPIDLLLETDPSGKTSKKSYDVYLQEWEKQMKAAYAIAKAKTEESRRKGRDRWAKEKLMLQEIEKGDRVLVMNQEKTEGKGRDKLRSFWENDVYIVQKRHPQNEVVYYIQKEKDPKSKVRSCIPW